MGYFYSLLKTKIVIIKRKKTKKTLSYRHVHIPVAIVNILKIDDKDEDIEWDIDDNSTKDVSNTQIYVKIGRRQL